MKIQCPEKITVGHLNINSIRNRFDALSSIIDTNIDILLISEARLGDSLTVAEFKMEFQKLKPQVITYRNYKNLNNDRFQADIKTCGFDTRDINSFKEAILSVFNKYAPIKKKYIRAN